MIYFLLVITLLIAIIILGIVNGRLIKERNEYKQGYDWTTRKFSEYVENTLEYIETLSPKDTE